MEIKKGGFLVFLLLVCISFVSAADFSYVISNSEDWKDVYSSLLYANLNGVKGEFLVSTSHGSVLLDGINKNNDIRIISSEDNRFVFNYESMVESDGFNSAEEIFMDNANLELVDELEVNDFVITGTNYGYNAIAVAPYALRTNSWVFLADRTNIAEIDNIMSDRNVDDVLIYGYVDRQVIEALEKYNPEIINTGDRFKDNIEIVEKYLEINSVNQVALTNGEFIEKELVNGEQPVLFTGKDNVPDQIADYLKSSDIEVGVLIGNDLVGAATNIRRSTGLSVMVKFARGSRSPGTGISVIEGLDLFYLPSPTLDIQIHSVQYNRANSQLEITYRSESNTQAYLKGTITLRNEDGETQRVGDVEPVFIAPNVYKTLIYPGIELGSEEDLFAEIYTLYGEVPSALDRVLSGTFNVTSIDVIDRCEIDVKKVSYNKQKNEFLIKIKNTAEVDCWAKVELRDIMINELEQTIGSRGAEKIEAGKTEKISISQRMAEEDLEDNSIVSLVAYYGERQDSLVKDFRGKFELDIDYFTFLTYVIIALIILIIILVILIIIIKRRDDDLY